MLVLQEIRNLASVSAQVHTEAVTSSQTDSFAGRRDVYPTTLTHHIPPFHRRDRPRQIPLCNVQPLDIRRDMLDNSFCFGCLLPDDVDLMYKLLKFDNRT